MKTLIITGGMIEADFALSFIQELKPDYILGVDKGLQFCYEYDIRPDYIVDSRNKIGLPVEKTFSLKKEEQYGTYVSLFPMGETVEGLTLKGFKYPLDHYQLKDREGLGVSNEITADVADVSWEQGVLLMIQSKD